MLNEKDMQDRINQLSGSEAKTILYHAMLRAKMIEASKVSQKEIGDFNTWLNEILTYPSKKRKADREYNAVHIVCGESPAGSLRVGLGRKNKVIGFPDVFAIGPIHGLHHESGRKLRSEWLRDHLNDQDDYFEKEYERRFSKAHAEIAAIPDRVPIIFWIAENANEQTGIRYLLYLLKEKTNDFFLINTTLAYQELFNTNECQYYFYHTGEVPPEELETMYLSKLAKLLTEVERKKYEDEWLSVSDTTGVLRIYEKEKIIAVDEDYFDEFIIATAQTLHAQQIEKDFIKSARIIGQVIGDIDNHVGDSFLEYRLRSLIYNGVFEIKGIPKGMRYYSVKVR